MNEYMQPVTLVIPKELENVQLPSPELLSYYTDMQRRIIWVDFEIDDRLLLIIKQILRWNQEDIGVPKEQRKPIHMLIFSPGGDLYLAFGCIDVMKLSVTPIITVNMGEASSAGLYLLLSGDKRYCLPNATSVLHSGSATLGGTASQVNSSAQYYKDQLNRMKNFVLERTTIDARTYKKRQDEDWYLSAEDQLKLGVVDGIVDSLAYIIGGEQLSV